MDKDEFTSAGVEGMEHMLHKQLSRRRFVKRKVEYLSALLAAPYLAGCSDSSESVIELPGGGGTRVSNLTHLGPLQDADANGCRLPEGFESRIIARSSEPVIPGSAFTWHGAPDGGACYEVDDGWIYVSNAELWGNGGVSAIRFDADGGVVDAYPILENTNRNCAGGTMPYGSWLSCEESGDVGRVFECDPAGETAPVERPALGYFNHEATAYHEGTHTLYLTEDQIDGGLYRFTASSRRSDGFADLSGGTLEVAQVVAEDTPGGVVWHTVSDPQAVVQPTRLQVAAMTPFRGGEGIICHEDLVTFTTKFDNRVWSYDVVAESMAVIYDRNASDNPILSGVDNIASNFAGEYLVAEDGGDMQIVVLTPEGDLSPLLQIVGQDLSEITGPAFSPDGTRLYFSSQRGVTGHSDDGLTYEVTGAFFTTEA
jgi:hypothetical protein